MKRMIFSIIVLAGLAGAGMAQTVRGRVVDIATGNGLPGVLAQATLFCTNPFGQTLPFTNNAMTDANGNYTVNYPVNGGSSCLNPRQEFAIAKPGYTLVARSGDTAVNNFVAVSDSLPRWSQVSAASYGPAAASDMITAAFGIGLADTTEIATTLPLPTTLAGRSVKVTDFAGMEKLARLLFVSPTQVNFIMPEGLAIGAGIVTLTGDNDFVRVSIVQVQKIAPGIFTANASGRGVVSAVILRKRADGTEQYEPVAEFIEAQRQWLPLPIDLGPDSDRIILALFGTGWRGVGAPSNVTVELKPVIDDGTPDQIRRPEVLYAGEQPTVVGLDQINIELPRNLAGKGEIEISVKMKAQPDVGFAYTLNTVRIAVK